MKGPEERGSIYTSLFTRQTFFQYTKEKPADLQIRRISGPNEPLPFSAKQLVNALQLSTNVVGASLMFSEGAFL